MENSLTKFERFFHFWVLVGRSFVRNRCFVRASALSYTTLLSLIPMLAVAMSVASVLLKSEGEARIRQAIEGFVDRIAPTAHVDPDITAPPASSDEPAVSRAPFENIYFDENAFRSAYGAGTNDASEAPLLSSEVATNPPPDDASTHAAKTEGATQVKKNVSHEAANFIYEFARRSYSGTLGATGMIFLVLTAILTLTRVEETFNDIWGVTQGRDWWSRITNYFFTIVAGTVLLVLAIGLMNGPNFEKSRQIIRVVPFLEPLLTNILPALIICFTFAMLYKLLPNTKVYFTAALVGGSLAGLAWHGYNHLGWVLASRAVSASAIYGSLFMLPLLMGGLYIVWVTILAGAQIAYAFQNRSSYLLDRLVENVNQRGREFVALRLMTCIGQRFNQGRPPITISEISAELGIPSKLVQQVLRTLLAANLVVEVAGRESGYSPARPLDAINCHHVLLAMRATHGQEPATRDEPVRVEVLGEFARIQAAEREAASAVTMLALVNRAQMRLNAKSTPTLPEITPPVAAAVLHPADTLAPKSGAAPTVKFSEPTTDAPYDAKPVEPVITSHEPEAQPEKKEPAPQKSFAPTTPVAATPNNENESFPL